MYKNLLVIFILLINLTFAKADEKITYLNIDSLIQNTSYGKTLLNEIEILNKKKISEFKKREQDIKKKEQDLINKKNVLSEEDFKKNALNIKKQMDNFNLDKRKSNVEFENKRNDLLNNFFKKIRPIIEEYVEENNISAVLNKKNIFIANKKYDITEELIKVINEKLK